MGMQSAQVQSGTQPQGKGFSQPLSSQQFQNREGSTTNSTTSGQPTFGQPNNYPNTVGQWDNASIQRQLPASIQRQPSSGKGLLGQPLNRQSFTQQSPIGGKGKG